MNNEHINNNKIKRDDIVVWVELREINFENCNWLIKRNFECKDKISSPTLIFNRCSYFDMIMYTKHKFNRKINYTAIGNKIYKDKRFENTEIYLTLRDTKEALEELYKILLLNNPHGIGEGAHTICFGRTALELKKSIIEAVTDTLYGEVEN